MDIVVCLHKKPFRIVIVSGCTCGLTDRQVRVHSPLSKLVHYHYVVFSLGIPESYRIFMFVFLKKRKIMHLYDNTKT